MVDVPVDILTPCLRDRKTGAIFQTAIEKIIPRLHDFSQWNFDWSIPAREKYDVYALRVQGDPHCQGLIALKPEPLNRAVHVDIIEAAPHNVGHSGKYEGVGAHLFAFACKTASDYGFHYIYFDAKTSLIAYYKERLGAEQLGKSQRMLLEGEAFQRLLKAYYGGG